MPEQPDAEEPTRIMPAEQAPPVPGVPALPAPPGYAVPAGYPPPGYGYYPYPPPGYDAYGRPLSDKSKVVAGVLGLTLGGLGIGRFYTGHVGLGVLQIVVTFLTCGLGHFWGMIDGILILVNGGTDAQGRVLRD
ncbi:MAG TPA: TM2 domain-containing protein [Rugosimonospora sp.]|nr:TM2 domain-containing protein [Rugosimonospora sp.]